MIYFWLMGDKNENLHRGQCSVEMGNLIQVSAGFQERHKIQANKSKNQQVPLLELLTC